MIEDIVLNEEHGNVLLKFAENTSLNEALNEISELLGKFYREKLDHPPYTQLKNKAISVNTPFIKKINDLEEYCYILRSDFPTIRGFDFRFHTSLRYFILGFFNVRVAPQNTSVYEIYFSRRQEVFRRPDFIRDDELAKRDRSEFCNYVRINILQTQTPIKP